MRLRVRRQAGGGHYKELVGSYRRVAGELDMREVEDCMAL